MLIMFHPPPEDVVAYLGSEPERVCVMQGVCIENPHVVVVTDYIPVANSSSSPELTFEVRKRDLRGIDYIVGFMHSHEESLPDPSPADLLGLPPGTVGAVWCTGAIEWYTPSGAAPIDGVISR